MLCVILLLSTACASAPAPVLTATPAPAPTAVPTPASSPTSAQTTSGSADGPITVSAAASLTDAFKEIGTAYEAQNPGAKVTFNFGSSSTLQTQLNQGAKAEVFASADQTQMDKAVQGGSISGTPKVFAANRLTII